mmetsp:Transcript_38822/g.123397  ORF Transcript_38822/g.123397 Transcript_38822/m.123397 type:complete len:207 (+) Transcript_38822:449-1069(+)
MICRPYSSTTARHSAAMTPCAPMARLILATSALGPVRRLVPVSAMAEQPPAQSSMGAEEPGESVTASMSNCQYPALVTGAHECSPTKCAGSTPPMTISPPGEAPALRFSQKEKTGASTSPCLRRLSKGGMTPSTEMVLKPRPRMPSNFAAMKASPGSLVASAKTWSSTFRSPSVRVSWERNPDREPLPYSIANSSPLACGKGDRGT